MLVVQFGFILLTEKGLALVSKLHVNIIDDLAIYGDIYYLLFWTKHAKLAEANVEGARCKLAIGMLRHNYVNSTRKCGWVEVVVSIADITAKALYIIHFSNFLKTTNYSSLSLFYFRAI